MVTPRISTLGRLRWKGHGFKGSLGSRGRPGFSEKIDGRIEGKMEVEEEGGEARKGRWEGKESRREGGREGRDGTRCSYPSGLGRDPPSPVSKFPVGCADDGHAPQLGESWFTEKSCTTLCTCSTPGHVTCTEAACEVNHMCLRQDGRLRCTAGKQGGAAGLGHSSPRLPPPSGIPSPPA